MTSRGCMYTAQGSLLCGKQLEHFEEEPPVYEGYYEDAEAEQPAYEGYYEEEPEAPTQEEYYNFGDDLQNMGKGIYNAGQGMIQSATHPFQHGPAAIGLRSLGNGPMGQEGEHMYGPRR